MAEVVKVERIFRVSRDMVWKMWSDTSFFMKWWGPERHTCPLCTMDFKEHGHFLWCSRSEDGADVYTAGQFLQIVPFELIRYSTYFADVLGNHVSSSTYGMAGIESMDVEVRFEDLGDLTTKLHVSHSGIPQEFVEDCALGWNSSFDKMDAVLAENLLENESH